MQTLTPTFATRLAITASIAALICASPVSVDLVRAGAAGADGTARLALTLDAAQAHETHGGGREAGSRGTAGRDHQASHEKGQRSADGGRANGAGGKNAAGNGIKSDNVNADNVRANDVKANNVRANDVKANDVRVNNVKVNDVNATNVNATYVRPPYLARPAAVTATAVAVGTTVAVLPASCTVVVDDGVTYQHCGDTYYVASNGAYVVVNPPR